MSSQPTQPSALSEALKDKARRAFLMRKLHSLSGALPVGGFMVFHLWTNAKALQGEESFQHAVGDIAAMPYLPVLEWGLILAPLLFHAIYGVKLALEGKPNVGRYPYGRNWMYVLQRVTGLVAFAFICFHLWEYWGQKQLGRLEGAQFYAALCKNLSSTTSGVPVTALVYLVGIAACAFHFANGLWGFCMSWGITVSRRAQQTVAAALGVLGLALFLLGANTVIHFATGSSLSGALFGQRDAGARTCAEVSRKAPSLVSSKDGNAANASPVADLRP